MSKNVKFNHNAETGDEAFGLNLEKVGKKFEGVISNDSGDGFIGGKLSTVVEAIFNSDLTRLELSAMLGYVRIQS